MKIAKASNAQYGVSRFATRDEVLDAASVPEIVIRPYDVYDFLNNSETVKDDVNTYVDPTTGEKINKTTIGAINEILSTAVVKLGVPDEDDVSTYIVRDLPASGVTNILGEKIHDIKQIIVTPTLAGITSPKPYIIYRLTELEDVYEPGLYMYDETGLVWIKVNGDDAIRTVDVLPTTNIKSNCFYKLKIEDTILGIFDITDEKKAAGYFCDKAGMHYRGEVSHDWTWAAIQEDWTSWYGDEIEDNPDGPIFSVEHSDGTIVLEFEHKDINNRLYYYHEGEWYEISPVFENKYMDADDNFITNIDADEFKRQEPTEKGKTWVVQDDGTWALGPAGGLVIVSELPKFDDALSGTAYYLNTQYYDDDAEIIREIGTYTVEEYTDPVTGDTLKKWSVVGMPNPNDYDFIKKLDDYMYEAYYSKIDFEYTKEFDDLADLGACTVAKRGKRVYRNFDWFYDETCEFVTHTPATAGGRHAVVGVCGAIGALTKDIVEGGEYNPYFKLVPYKLLDGINDCGLMMAVLVCPYEESAIPTTGTLPTSTNTINASYAVRYILDNCKDVDDARDTFENKVNWYVSEKTREMGYELHFFVADANGKSGYLYFKNNEAHSWEFTETCGDNVIDYPIVTNFSLDGVTFVAPDLKAPVTPYWAETRGVNPYSHGMTKHSSGVERYYHMMYEVTNDSDWNSYVEVFGQARYNFGFTGLYEGRPSSPNYTQWSDIVGVSGLQYADPIANYNMVLTPIKTAWASRERNGTFWQTVHTSYYDLETFTLEVYGQEELYAYHSGARPWVFKLASAFTGRINGHDIIYTSTTDTLDIKKTISVHDYEKLVEADEVKGYTIYFVE